MKRIIRVFPRRTKATPDDDLVRINCGPELWGKRCAKCGKTKLVNQFHKKSAQSDGFATRCKMCIHEDSADYYARTQKEQSLKAKKRYIENRETVNE